MWYQPEHQALNIKSINTLTGHQALNIRAKAHRASSPQLQMIMHGLKNVQLRQIHNLYDPISWNNNLQLYNLDQHLQLNDNNGSTTTETAT
ncbi:hypothetical protein MTR_3g082087 [Medicago truncatula]|uniref:Uncharacterized protein n=1 Tax=Medicago truncatula TaxID=3880 RepID=A0A072UZI1_MEDTR|nr:hypothetical protein MTR_3g082087 [Medicago truncatula]